MARFKHNSHLIQFIVACSVNNAKIDENWKMIFPKTLKVVAFQWYDKQAHGTFPNCITLRDGFLAQIGPLGFVNKSPKQLTKIQMVSRNSITSYVKKNGKHIKEME
jgi:hypothetical protein